MVDDTGDTAAWVLVGVMTVGCCLVVRGQGFAVDGPAALLPGLGLLVLVTGMAIGHRRRQARLFAGATAFVQMTLFTVLAVTIAYALAAWHRPLWDARLAAADARLGLDWPAIRRVADRWPAALWLGGVAYRSLIAQMVVAIVALSAAGRFGALRAAVAAAIAGGATTVAIAGAMPAMGNLFDPAPYHHLPASIAWQERGLIAGLRDGTGRVLDYGNLMGIVSFPSFHATLPVILAWSVREVRGLRVAAPVWAAITVAATPIFGGHYAVDVLAGLLLAVGAIPFGAAVARWRFSPAQQPGRRHVAGEAARALHARRLAREGVA